MKSKLTEGVFSESGIENKFINAAANTHTRRARRIDMIDFVNAFREADSRDRSRYQSPALGLIHSPPQEAKAMLMQYQARMLKQNLAVSTINRRLATMRAWVRYAHESSFTGSSPDALVGELVTDAELREREIEPLAMSQLCVQPDVSNLRGLRDAALLHLICEVPLLGWQLGSLCVADVLVEDSKLRIPIVNSDAYSTDGDNLLDKFHDETRFVTVNVMPETMEVIREYLSKNQLQQKLESPLFINFDRCPSHQGKGIVPKSVLHLVKEYGKQIGIQTLNARSIRVSAIVKTLEDANWKASIAHRRFPHVGLHTWFHYARDH